MIRSMIHLAIQKNAAFVVEAKRIMSMLTCSDLLRLSRFILPIIHRGCTNSYFHRLLRRDEIWDCAFANNTPMEIQFALSHEWIQKKWEKLQKANSTSEPSKESRDDDSQSERTQHPDSSAEPTLESDEGNTVSFDELSLLYRVNANEGWYIDNDDNCYYIIVHNHKEKQFEIVYARLQLALLDMLAEQVVSTQ